MWPNELQAAARPDACTDPARQISFRELVNAVHVVAARLLAGGIKPGQVVGVSMVQTSLHLVSLLALVRSGQCPCRAVATRNDAV